MRQRKGYAGIFDESTRSSPAGYPCGGCDFAANSPRRSGLGLRLALPGRCGGFRALLDQTAGVVEDAVQAEFEVGLIRGRDAVSLATHLSDQWSGCRVDGHGVLDGAWSALGRLVLFVEPL